MSLQQFYIETHINTDVEDTMKCCEMGIGLVKWRCFKTAVFRKMHCGGVVLTAFARCDQ